MKGKGLLEDQYKRKLPEGRLQHRSQDSLSQHRRSKLYHLFVQELLPSKVELQACLLQGCPGSPPLLPLLHCRIRHSVETFIQRRRLCLRLQSLQEFFPKEPQARLEGCLRRQLLLQLLQHCRIRHSVELFIQRRRLCLRLQSLQEVFPNKVELQARRLEGCFGTPAPPL